MRVPNRPACLRDTAPGYTSTDDGEASMVEECMHEKGPLAHAECFDLQPCRQD